MKFRLRSNSHFDRNLQPTHIMSLNDPNRYLLKQRFERGGGFDR